MARLFSNKSQAAAERTIARCRELATTPYSDMPDGLFRPFLGPAHMATINRVTDWMGDAGLSTRRDAACTIFGRYEGMSPCAPALLIGSHIDSVRNAGVFDGALGVMLAIECVAALHAGACRLPFAIEIAAFGDEEGSRFPQSMLGARAFTGKPVGQVADMRDRDGHTLQDAMTAIGLDANRLADAQRSGHDILAYIEPHIEQGPVLDQETLSVAAVEAIAGIRRFQVLLKGEAGHAGTVPMSMRRDAFAAASEIALLVEAYALRSDDRLRATVGKADVKPGAINIIPGCVTLTVELRSADKARLDQGALDIISLAKDICHRRKIDISVYDRQDFEPCACAAELTAMLEDCIVQTGRPRRRLVSGAGHDAMMLCDWTPSTMLFIRSPGGISHHPEENVTPPDVAAAFEVMMEFIQAFGTMYHDTKGKNTPCKTTG